MTALSLEALRKNAVDNNGGGNIDVASAWSLRWYDPFWIAAWERWNAARAGWRKVWPYLDWNQFGSVYDPTPEGILDLSQRAIAQEFLDARKAYTASFDMYPGDDETETPETESFCTCLGSSDDVPLREDHGGRCVKCGKTK